MRQETTMGCPMCVPVPACACACQVNTCVHVLAKVCTLVCTSVRTPVCTGATLSKPMCTAVHIKK